MRWGSAVSSKASTEAAIEEVCHGVREQLGGSTPSVAFVFVSAHHAPGYRRLVRDLAEAFPSAVILGCSAGGVIGAGSEYESEPAVSVMAGFLPDVAVQPFYLRPDAVDATASPERWQAAIGVEPLLQPALVVLPDPFTAKVDDLLSGLARVYPGRPVVGGLVSGGRAAGEHALFVDGRVHRIGTVGVALYGDIEIEPLVSQGARPFGIPMKVTRTDGRLLHDLDGTPALQRAEQALRTLTAEEAALFQRQPLLGVSPGRPGGYLVRDVLGIDRSTGGLAVAYPLGTGDHVQFCLRDAESASSELDSLLAGSGDDTAAALMFSCLGRGERFFGRRDHDAEALRRRFGPIAAGGFFCNGEIGPVHGRPQLHGYTNSMALFRRRVWD